MGRAAGLVFLHDVFDIFGGQEALRAMRRPVMA
jgi:hypothetical protein